MARAKNPESSPAAKPQMKPKPAQRKAVAIPVHDGHGPFPNFPPNYPPSGKRLNLSGDPGPNTLTDSNKLENP